MVRCWTAIGPRGNYIGVWTRFPWVSSTRTTNQTNRVFKIKPLRQGTSSRWVETHTTVEYSISLTSSWFSTEEFHCKESRDLLDSINSFIWFFSNSIDLFPCLHTQNQYHLISAGNFHNYYEFNKPEERIQYLQTIFHRNDDNNNNNKSNKDLLISRRRASTMNNNTNENKAVFTIMVSSLPSRGSFFFSSVLSIQ